MDSGMSNILNSGFMPYTTAASLEMSDEPNFLYLCKRFEFQGITAILRKKNEKNPDGRCHKTLSGALMG